MNDENKNNYISIWLLLITLLVALTIVVGGLTRLTDSGLSITKWDLFIGIFPPFTLSEWDKAFNLYKQIPEYSLVYPTMTLDEFKVIFWWEYIHRLIGRLIGLLYLFPLLYFTYKKSFSKKTLKSLYLILILILIQGFIGWYMVESGLTERTDVSHYRLSIHLTVAFIIFILLFWNFLKNRNELDYSYKDKKRVPSYLIKLLIFLIIIQISIGAFVSGLDAGQIYQTWPLMNQSYFPNDSVLKDLFSLKAFETPSLVQFIHRNVAYFIFVIFVIITFKIFKNDDFLYLRKNMLFSFVVLIFQIVLGILTILSGANIYLASLHQLGSIILIATLILLHFKNMYGLTNGF